MKNLIKTTLEKKFNEKQFKEFIQNLLNGVEFREVTNGLVPNLYKDFIKSYKRIAKYKFENDDFVDNVIDVLVVKLKKTTSIDRARTAQRNFVAWYLNGSRDYQKDAALVAFISEDENNEISPDWRFSLIKMDYVTTFIEDENGNPIKRKTSKELTPAKRFSFLVGENENSHTAQKQLLKCLEKSAKKEQVTLEDLVEAFSIEKVSKEFFEKYKNLFADIKEELDRLYEENDAIRADFDNHNINIVDFAKKTLGQLVFLYFIQKKGWLGVNIDENWGSGDKKFLQNLFNNEYGKYENFFNNVLEPMFYAALAEDRRLNNDKFEFNEIDNKPGFRIPFLNGGLFEPINDYQWDKTNITIKNDIFKTIFETFNLYNFTIKEDEPLEKEVAIDPEMLGKVFEELLDVKDRKSKGAFYTPREIVHYMCQESLINYLYSKVNIKTVGITEDEKQQQLKLINTKKDKQLKLTKEVFEEIISKEDISKFIHTGESTYKNNDKKKDISVDLPGSIKQHSGIIDNALADIKVCDPAIGSGAFPVGMMNEIVRARMALNICNEFKTDNSRSAYKFKRHTVENSIYGVDLDNGAVEIAKLRFWLSLVVDEEDLKEIKPLPNLDYKIMQGNSLISSYEGIDFDKIIESQKNNQQLSLLSSVGDNIAVLLKDKINKIKRAHSKQEKQDLKQGIETLIVELVKTKLEEKKQLITSNAQDKIKELEDHIRNFAKNREFRNFFPWKLYFADAFDNGGFDVVIGNPPYVSLEALKDPYKDDLKSFECYAGKADLLYFFYEKGVKITKKGAGVSYITSRYFLEATYAKKLREYLIKNTNIKLLIDFGDIKIFDNADIHTCIVFLKNDNSELNDIKIMKFNSNTEDMMYELNKSESNNIKSFCKINQSDLNDEGWSFSDYTITNLRNKIAYKCTTLKDIAIIEQGQKSGLNNVFNVSLNTIEKYSLEKEALRKCIKNSHINKYSVDFQEQYLIYTDDDFKIDKFPNIKKYLNEHKESLYNRAEAKDDKYSWYRLQRPRKKSLFEVDEKIVVPYRATENKFAYDDQKYFNDGGDIRIIVANNDSISTKYILAILNSKLMNFYFSFIGRRKGNVFEYFVEPLYKIPIKNAAKNKQQPIINIVDKIIELTHSKDFQNNETKQQLFENYENQIDEMVYQLYELTEEEILLIEPDRLVGHKFESKPSVKDIVEKIASSKPDLMDNDRAFCHLFDTLALSNGFTEDSLPAYWSIGRAIYNYKKENGISADENAKTTSALAKELDTNNPILNQFKFDIPKPSIRKIIEKIAEYDINLFDDDRKLIDLFDGIALTNGYEKNNLPKYWTIIRASFDYKKEAVNV